MINNMKLGCLMMLFTATMVLGAGGIIPGNGTESNPYLIEDLADFDLFADEANAQVYWAEGIYTKLKGDINLSGRIYNTALLAQNERYHGVFDGQGYQIKNLKVDSNSSYAAVFGKLSESAEVNNLGINDCRIEGRSYVGGLVGSNGGKIVNCYVNGIIKGTGYDMCGGLAGLSYGSIIRCYSTGSVIGKNQVGGLVGENMGMILSCYSSCLVSCNGTTSGIGESYAGGLVGNNGDIYIQGSPKIINCYSSGGVNSALSDKKGGLVGYNFNGCAVNSYWDINISNISDSWGGIPKTTTELKNISTFIGWGDGSWVIDSGIDYPRLVWEKTVGDIIDIDYSARVYSGAGTSADPFVLTTSDDVVNMGVRVSDWKGHFVLANDIDMSGVGNYTPPTCFEGVFNGNGHKIINLKLDTSLSGVRRQVGMFGYVDVDGVIKNLELLDVNIKGGSFVGALAGFVNEGIIENCHTSGSVVGTQEYDVGGLLGNICYGMVEKCSSSCTVQGPMSVGGLSGTIHGATVRKSFASGNVYGDHLVGGLVGQAYAGVFSGISSYIVDSYASGKVDGFGYVGGLVGGNNGSIERCYSVAYSWIGFISYNTGSVLDCFWNVENCIKPVSEGGAVKTSFEMQSIGTYLDAGWDFVDENINGNEDIWHMPNGTFGYPMLEWQKDIPGDISGRYSVDIEDFSEISSSWMSKYYLEDLEILASNWLSEPVMIPPPTLALHYSLDSTDVDDSSEYGRNGTAFGEIRLIEGIDGNCYDFDGVNDYIEVAGFVGVNGISARTVSVWVKLDEDLNNSDKTMFTIVSWGKGDNADPYKKWLMIIDESTGKLALSIYDARLKGGPDLEDGQWHHVALVLPEQANNINEVRMYIDGKEVETNASTLDAVIDTAITENVLIGASDSDPSSGIQSPGRFFKGAIDNIYIYNAALNAEEIAELAQ